MSSLLGLLALAKSRLVQLALGIGMVLTVLGSIWLAGRRQGKASVETDALKNALQTRSVRDEVDRAVARSPGAADRLREQWSRD